MQLYHVNYTFAGDSCTIQFEVYVNPSTAPQLNSGDDTIEDILVLHLEGGKDLFVTVCGSYLPSCFGSSVEALVNMFKPIRDVETALLIDLVCIYITSDEVPGQNMIKIIKLKVLILANFYFFIREIIFELESISYSI